MSKARFTISLRVYRDNAGLYIYAGLWHTGGTPNVWPKMKT